ncbi:MAG TPA: hypothetical protein VF020_13365 [Chthoniobacterales bacterium]
MPNGPVFALLIMTLLSFPVALSRTNGSITAPCTELAGDGLLHTPRTDPFPSMARLLPVASLYLIHGPAAAGRLLD